MHALLFLALAASPAQTSTEASAILASVPSDANVLMHCRDADGLRARSELNDWYRVLASEEGEPLLRGLAREFRTQAHSELDALLAIAAALEGEAVFFDTGKVAGFVTEPPRDRAAFAALVREWMPDADAGARRTQKIAGGSVELVAWPDEIDGWAGRAGHFAAFLEHPQALGIFSGDDAEAVLAALTEGVEGLVAGRRAPVVDSYLSYGGGTARGVELFIDFTPLVAQAEAALKSTMQGNLPDPTDMLGLEAGTWLHARADVFPGTRVECRARLHVPPQSLAAHLADTFVPLPPTLASDLPDGAWGLWALGWDLKLFYQRVRSAFEEKGRGEGFEMIDAGIEAARGLVGIDPIVDVLNQLAGDFAFYYVDPPSRVDPQSGAADDDVRMTEWLSLGFQAGLVDAEAFLSAFETLIEVGDLRSVLDLEEIAGVDAYLMEQGQDFDGGLAFLPRSFAGAPTRRVLERSLAALTRAEGAGLAANSPTRAAIGENQDACFLSCVEMTPLRMFLLPQTKDDWRLPPLEEGAPARDPFDAQLVGTARRTSDGFEFRLETR